MKSKLTYSEIQSISTQLNSSATSMGNILNEIQTLFNKVGDEGTWSGTAASQTKETFDQLVAKFPNFTEAVQSCSTYLNSAVENYQSVDQMVSGQN